MIIKIGKVQSDGQIRNIKITGEPTELKETMEEFSNILKRFYSRPHRLDTLLDLGNLHCLGPSPYYKFKGNGDTVNCQANVRDYNESRTTHKDRLAIDQQAFMDNTNYGFLFEEGHWYILTGENKYLLSEFPYDTLKKKSPLNKIEVYSYKKPSYNNKAMLESLYKVKNWEEIQEKANEKKAPLYVFNDSKLINIIHPVTTQTQAV